MVKNNSKKKVWNKGIRTGIHPKSEFKKGNPGYWKGKSRSEETKLKLSTTLKGRPSNGILEQWKKNNNAPAQGKRWKIKDTSKMRGRVPWNYKGGTINNPYPREFSKELKLKIRTRDGFICCLCGRTEREELDELNYVLCVNHIDFNKNNCDEKNLNTLCRRCNIKINRDREYWTNYFNQKYA